MSRKEGEEATYGAERWGFQEGITGSVLTL